ncbi:hypothetical protein M2447_002781 [Ereboglobus sp. PH5-10]|uniref:hypothetical protein n=1 Tax=Ereboglobus sp. PH5-10 TaxID=2940629 RepID=UPI002407278B|nr:hypothetical protein [Ereboglobus sp. PH5-10]MDF9828653.1 hypothetical protein [Ereboglobus sp. PH5-10]
MSSNLLLSDKSSDDETKHQLLNPMDSTVVQTALRDILNGFVKFGKRNEIDHRLSDALMRALTAFLPDGTELIVGASHDPRIESALVAIEKEIRSQVRKKSIPLDRSTVFRIINELVIFLRIKTSTKGEIPQTRAQLQALEKCPIQEQAIIWKTTILKNSGTNITRNHILETARARGLQIKESNPSNAEILKQLRGKWKILRDAKNKKESKSVTYEIDVLLGKSNTPKPKTIKRSFTGDPPKNGEKTSVPKREAPPPPTEEPKQATEKATEPANQKKHTEGDALLGKNSGKTPDSPHSKAPESLAEETKQVSPTDTPQVDMANPAKQQATATAQRQLGLLGFGQTPLPKITSDPFPKNTEPHLEKTAKSAPNKRSPSAYYSETKTEVHLKFDSRETYLEIIKATLNFADMGFKFDGKKWVINRDQLIQLENLTSDDLVLKLQNLGLKILPFETTGTEGAK